MKTKGYLLLLFLCLGLSSLVRAQVGVTLLVKADMTCDWKLDGQPMGLLSGGDSKVVLVSPGEHLLEAFASNGATVRNSVTVDRVEKTVEFELKAPSELQPKMLDAEKSTERTGATQRSTWSDPSSGLTWTGMDNGSDVTWSQATAFCASLQLVGHRDWRLPTIEELQSIYDLTISVRKKLDNGVSYDLHVKGNLIISGWQWSSSPANSAGQVLEFNFGIKETRGAFPRGFKYSMRALCVRRADG